MADATTLRDKFRGALLGTFVGDALGAPLEGWDEDRLNATIHHFNDLDENDPDRNKLESMLGPLVGATLVPDSAPYTDDTEMMISVAEALIEPGEFQGEFLASRFVENFHPWRGYGSGAHTLIMELKSGEPWNEVADRLFGGMGSFGNGAAMRVAPVGVFCHTPQSDLISLATGQARITHTHPDGIEGALIQAAAVAVACAQSSENKDDFDPLAFLNAVRDRVAGSLGTTFQDRLDMVEKLIIDPAPAWDVADFLGTDVDARFSVPTAFYAFAMHPYSFSAAVSYAIRLGGDSDTIGAMCGAIAGAYHGASGIPQEWLDALENGDRGRDYVYALADRLYDRWEAL